MPSSLRPILESHPIPVEVCPTSNVMTLELATSFQGNLVEGLRRHPQLEYWLKKGYPISISTDDPGVFHTDPTKEWILLVVTFNMNVAQIKRIILESLDHAFCDNSLKKVIRESIMSYFKQIDIMIEK
jgi:adenosine deaminase